MQGAMLTFPVSSRLKDAFCSKYIPYYIAIKLIKFNINYYLNLSFTTF